MLRRKSEIQRIAFPRSPRKSTPCLRSILTPLFLTVMILRTKGRVKKVEKYNPWTSARQNVILVLLWCGRRVAVTGSESHTHHLSFVLKTGCVL